MGLASRDASGSARARSADRADRPAFELRRRLEGVRRWAWWLLVAQRTGLVLGWAVMALIVGAALDYGLRAPGALRTVGLIGAVGTLAWAVRTLIRPAVLFKPSLTALALRIEGAGAGREAGLQDILAAGIDLSSPGACSGSARLADTVVVAAAERVARLESAGVFAPARTGMAVGWAALSVSLLLGFAAVSPELTRTGVVRMLWPWGGTEWPKRTGIVDATGVSVHPLGTALALRAVLTKHAGPAGSARVSARYRIITEGTPGPEQRVLLTSQDRSVDLTVPGNEGPVSGSLFERLIEPKSLTRDGDVGMAERRVELEYAIASLDDETSIGRIRLVEPPAVVKAVAEVSPPRYLEPEEGGAKRNVVDLGAGTDERAAPAPILAGSGLRLALDFNKPLPPPPPVSDPGFESWARRTLGPEAASLLTRGPAGMPAATLESAGSRWTMTWTVGDTVRLTVRPVDEFGLGGVDEAVFRIDTLTDKPPTASVTLPMEDRSVLPTAELDVSGEARDDVAVAWVALERQIARRAGGSEGGAPEPTGERVELDRRTSAADAAAAAASGGKRLTSSARLDLSMLDLKAGDEVWITALAADTYELGGVRHEPVRSSVRRVRIMSRQELLDQLWGELAGVRRAAIKLDQDQAETRQLSARPGDEAAHEGERSQAGISERVSRQAEAVKRVRQRLTENDVSDPSLEQVAREASEMLGRAGGDSVAAAAALAKAAIAQAQEDQPADAGMAERKQAAERQQSVRDELGNLIDLLDQGEDSFASKRSLERLLEQQKQLRERTAAAARETAGKSAEQLTAEQRRALDRIAQEQRAEAEQLREAVRKMQEREQRLRKNDPAAAQAMSQAARRAEREQVAQKMERAAQQAQQNQVGAAQQSQSGAMQTMEQMLQDLEQAQANKDEVLMRFLASLIESIDALIQNQKSQRRALDERRGGGDFAGLDQGMASLHQNTLGVLDQAGEGPRELAPVVKTLGEAAAAQAEAVVALRAAPVFDAEAGDRENTSLERLEAARKQAEQLDKQAEQRQSGRKREELRKKYEQILARQVSIRDSVEGLSKAEQTRRAKAAARLLGEEQGEVKEELSKLRKDTKELGNAKVFDFAHRRLDELTGEAAGRLREGEADAAVVQRQSSAARVLRSLVEALADSKKSDEPFRESQGGGGGGSSPQPMIPPAAELVLLRSMQQEAAEMTRAADEPATPVSEQDRLDQAARLQRDLADQAQDLIERLRPKDPPGDGPKGKGGGL